MTMEEAANAVRLYVEAKEFCSGNSMGSWNWLERLDDCLADIRAELASACQAINEAMDALERLERQLP